MFLTPPGIKAVSLLTFAFAVLSLLCIAQTSELPVYDPVNREVLLQHDARAKDLVSNNLNRYGYEKLKAYDLLLDSFFNAELNDTLLKIDNKNRLETASRKNQVDGYRSNKEELILEQTKLESRYYSLVRKALIAFAVWLVIVLLLLQFRKKGLKKIRTQVETSSANLNYMEEQAAGTKGIYDYMKGIEPALKKLSQEYSGLSSLVTASSNESNTPPDWKALSQKTEQIKRMSESEAHVAEAVLLQEHDPVEEKTDVDINILCEQYLEMAYRGFPKTEGAEIQVSRDLEKKLPAIKVNRQAVGTLLLNILMNSFQSVKAKSEMGIKGYQPKVAVSTRILPRFLQVRIRDNGIGMKEDLLQKATDEFYSASGEIGRPGLGLSIARTVISEMHKGEMKIESEEGNSTDVYIKFFI